MPEDKKKIAVENAKKALESNQFNARVLKRKSKPIEVIDDKIRDFADSLVKTLTENRGTGIAAPQVGSHIRMIAVWIENEGYKVLINPKIKEQSEKTQIIEELCLSFPGVSGKVYRPKEITVEALDLNGETITVRGEGIIAARLSHEIDHLDGILFVEKARKLKDTNKSMEQYYASYKKWLKSKNVSEKKGLTKHETNRNFIIRMIETIKQKIKQIIKRNQKMTKGDNESENTQPSKTQEPQTHSWKLKSIPGLKNENNNPINQQPKSERGDISQDRAQSEHDEI